MMRRKVSSDVIVRRQTDEFDGRRRRPSPSEVKRSIYQTLLRVSRISVCSCGFKPHEHTDILLHEKVSAPESHIDLR
jgi:hypothetical protein